MKKTPAWDREEGRLLAEYERGAFKPVPNHEKAKREAVEPPGATFAKMNGSIFGSRPPT